VTSQMTEPGVTRKIASATENGVGTGVGCRKPITIGGPVGYQR